MEATVIMKTFISYRFHLFNLCVFDLASRPIVFGAELAVAGTFTFSFLGFLISRLPLLLFPFGILHFSNCGFGGVCAEKRIHGFPE